MKPFENPVNRRNFIKTTASVAGLSVLPHLGFAKENYGDESFHIIGPREGFSPQVGTLLSMMTWMRRVVLWSVEKMTKEELDYLHDTKANTIGSMLLHLAATERIYQEGTFDGKKYKNEKVDWDAAMGLGDAGRKTIKGNTLDYYTTILNDTRSFTMEEFRKRDDQWLAKVDPSFFENQPTNNYCKWFHVCEHESNHNGQIKWIKGRLPGAVQGKE